jgi:ABC-type branched-subunit amino acid transport system substrate-binding protein
VLAAVVSACGGQHRRAHLSARTLSIYTSLPFEGTYANEARSILDAERLALSQTGGSVDGFKVVLRPLDDSSAATGQPDPALIADNARRAAADASTIAYIGELAPGSSGGAIPILTGAGILQVTPGDTATSLAGPTFARVIPPDGREAVAQLEAMRKLGVKRLFVIEQRGSSYGADIAAAAQANAPAQGIEILDPGGHYLGGSMTSIVRTIVRSDADGMLFAGGPAPDVGAFWSALSAADASIKKFGSASISGEVSAAARYDTYLSAPGLARGELPRAGLQFITDFARYGTQVHWPSGIFGYVAMSGVLNALYQLRPRAHDQRARVMAAFLGTRTLPSALGSYSIVGGETTFDSYFFTDYDRAGRAQSYVP